MKHRYFGNLIEGHILFTLSERHSNDPWFAIKGYEFEPSTHCDDSIAWLEKHDDFDSAVEYCNTHSNCLCINYSKSGGCYTTKEGLKLTYNFGYDAWVILSMSYY